MVIMDTKRTIIRVTVVLLLALGAGHLVQNMQKNQPGRAAHTDALGGIEQVVAGSKQRILPQPASRARTDGNVILHPPQTSLPPDDIPAPRGAADDQSALNPVPATAAFASAASGSQSPRTGTRPVI
ncbi:hypothetical protein [Pseudogemmobacter bohemicus]|uniref:hypothetical protein n=1 Tax=Pseudogemmobacter bohemicus TaxID=2250708 RepID=UPI0013003714|nr:hypothetical protein [Pseudogemmobacter bohemicus]